MPLIASANNETDREPIPLGTHHAVCCYVADLGMQFSEQYQKYARKIVVIWDLAKKQKDGKPFQVSKRYTFSLGDKAILRRDLEAWRGRPFTAQELAGFDLEQMLGKNCLLTIVETEPRGGKTYRDVTAVTACVEGMPPLAPTKFDSEPKWITEARAKNAAAFQARKQLVDKPAGTAAPVPPVEVAAPSYVVPQRRAITGGEDMVPF
jgi:hypothetical protein